MFTEVLESPEMTVSALRRAVVWICRLWDTAACNRQERQIWVGALETRSWSSDREKAAIVRMVVDCRIVVDRPV